MLLRSLYFSCPSPSPLPPRAIIPDARPLGTFENQVRRGISRRSHEKIGDCEQSASTGDQIDKCPDKEIIQRGKLVFARGMFQYNVDETACTSYVQHLEFLDAKAKKRVRERNTLPLISWTIEKDVKALTNKLLKMYLKQKGLKSGCQ